MRDQCNHCAVKICLIYFTLHCHDHHKKREQILTYHHHLIHTVERCLDGVHNVLEELRAKIVDIEPRLERVASGGGRGSSSYGLTNEACKRLDRWATGP